MVGADGLASSIERMAGGGSGCVAGAAAPGGAMGCIDGRPAAGAGGAILGGPSRDGLGGPPPPAAPILGASDGAPDRVGLGGAAPAEGAGPPSLGSGGGVMVGRGGAPCCRRGEEELLSVERRYQGSRGLVEAQVGICAGHGAASHSRSQRYTNH